MTTVPRLNKGDMGVGKDLRSRLGKEADEWVILCAENERRYSNAIDNTGARRSVIVVVSVAKTAVMGNYLLIELPD